ncbi:DHH family phosphoesterase [Mycoplasmopsis ciconiae]|uniref:DHH family phosphoesterase n=1 Tax=Mycoplasmopsis ciconiae TaxID=561067 RepID=A0ABU7ML56_9BACT|nr:DHH family phosphoesterase [Mycoplasmopsis ciconiae]
MVKNSFNSFIEDIITNNNFGIITYDNDQKIIWVSSFIKHNLNNDPIGLNVKEFFENYIKNADDLLTKVSFQFNYKSNYYEAQVWPLKNTISIRDITGEMNIIKESNEQKIVIGEIEIDNYQLYQSILSEEQLFNINKQVINKIEKCAQEQGYNLIYRQYTNGKFIVICNEKTLELLQEQEFKNMLNFDDTTTFGDQYQLSVSIGFAKGWLSLNDKIDQAKKALLQSKNRGGDQVTIFSNTSAPIYYGSTSVIMSDNSRTQIKLISNLLETKLKSKDVSKVIIYGHNYCDLDSLGSAYALWKIAKNYNKKAYICNITFDTTTEKVIQKYNLRKTDMFIRPFQANKITDLNTVVIFVDNSAISRTDNPEAINNAKNENIFIFDHHRVGSSVDFCPRSNRYIDPNASSACEIITEIITFMEGKNEIDSTTAQMLMNGIYLDTGQFTKSITPRAFSAASWLESKGARGAISTEILKIDEKTSNLVNELLENIHEVKKGYFLAYKDIEVSNDTISIAADEILKISGRVAGFVVAKQAGTNNYKLSARGIKTNVQIICEAVGGGGHFGTAAAVTNEPLDIFIDNIKQAIVGSHKNESNIN